MPVLAPQPRWGWWGRPSSSFAAVCGECRLWQLALPCPGPGKAPWGGGSGREGAGPGIQECVRSASCLFHSAFLIKISLRMIHTGESVWMDSLMASSGPKDGSTSPSATPLENEPIWM